MTIKVSKPSINLREALSELQGLAQVDEVNPWFQAMVNGQTAPTASVGRLAISKGHQNGVIISAANDEITINESGLWKLTLDINGVMTEQASSRWMENYIYLNGVKVLDRRMFVIDIDSNNEYFHVGGSVVLNLNEGDIIVVKAQWQRAGDIGYNSHLMGELIHR